MRHRFNMRDMKGVCILTLLMFSLVSCKKDYVCKCSDLSVPDHTFTIHDTKEKAKKQCSETIYYTGGCTLQ